MASIAPIQALARAVQPELLGGLGKGSRRARGRWRARVAALPYPGPILLGRGRLRRAGRPPQVVVTTGCEFQAPQTSVAVPAARALLFADVLLVLLQDGASAPVPPEEEGDRAWGAVGWHALERVLPADVMDGVALADGAPSPAPPSTGLAVAPPLAPPPALFLTLLILLFLLILLIFLLMLLPILLLLLLLLLLLAPSHAGAAPQLRGSASAA